MFLSPVSVAPLTTSALFSPAASQPDSPLHSQSAAGAPDAAAEACGSNPAVVQRVAPTITGRKSTSFDKLGLV